MLMKKIFTQLMAVGASLIALTASAEAQEAVKASTFGYEKATVQKAPAKADAQETWKAIGKATWVEGPTDI